MEYICNYCNTSFGNHKTEYRNHRKTCKCKPVEYTCEFCGKKFNRAGVYTAHKEYQCTLNPDKKEQKHVCGFKIHQEKYGATSKEGGWNCVCGENFRTKRLLEAHKKTCKLTDIKTSSSKRLTHIQYADFTCNYCKETFIHKPVNVKSTHERFCHKNPNRSVRHNEGKHVSDEVKKRISETMKRKITEGSIIVPYKRNHSSKASYPEKYFMEVFKNLPVKYNYQVGLYQLDFAIPEKMVYIEIDGEQHFCDKRIVEHDKERTEKLKSLGWTCLRRVRWSDYKKLDNEQQKQYCNELVQLLSK